jgi:carboxymethylenebutenolidase
MGQMIELRADDGFTLSAYRADPQGAPRGGLVVVQEIFGVNAHIRAVCDGYAADGYRVIAPALFDRAERGVDIGYSPAEIQRGIGLKQKSGIDNALRDVAAARDALKEAGKVGITGYCWGGYVTWMAASRSTGFACAIPYYGGGMLEASGEHQKCPVMAHFSERDQHIPV